MISWLKRVTNAHPISDEELSTYADGRLEPARAARVEAHAGACETCRLALSELRAVKAMLAAMPAAQPSRSFALTPEQAGRGATPHPTPRPAGRLAFVPALAMTVLVLLVGVDLVSFGSSSSDEVASFGRAVEKSADAATASLGEPPAVTGARNAAAAGTPAGAAASGAAAELPSVAAQAAVGVSPTPAAAADSVQAREQPRVAPPSRDEAAVSDQDGASPGVNVLRALQIAAAATFAASLAWMWYRRRTAGA